MYRSRQLQAPIITFLSPSLAASKKATALISTVGNFEESISVVTNDLDTHQNSKKGLNDTFKTTIPGLPAYSWESVGVRDTVSGSVIHFCSFGRELSINKNENENDKQKPPFALLAITDTGNYDEEPSNDTGSNSKVNAAIRNARSELASKISDGGTLNIASLIIKYFVKGNLTVNDLLKTDGLPLLSIPNTVDDKVSSYSTNSSTCLKEIVVPHFDYAAYRNGSTFLSELGLARTRKPAVGVYEWPNASTCIRPLPTAGEDRTLPSPSLIFHCDAPENESCFIKEHGFQEARIGFGGGRMNKGQVMLLHNDLLGLDVRYCPQTNISSAFSESQESLLAGSIKELQSKNTLLAVGEKGKHDERILNGDCWIEERAKFRQPLSYFRSKKPLRSAKIP